MEAHEASFKSITDKYQKLIIPFYQRSYVWDKEDWSKFYEDLYISMENEKDHFLGSVLIKESDNQKEGYVVDGQQRLTTFSLLLRSLFTEKLKELWIHEGAFPSLWLFLESDGAVSKIEHSYLDSKEFKSLVDYYRKSPIVLTRNSSNMAQCYSYFEEQICRLDENIQKKFFKYLISKDLFVDITVDSSEDEQKIFDSINTTGEPLTVTDIIKNDLFHCLLRTESTTLETINSYYDEYWKSIFEMIPEQARFWNTKHTIGRYKRYRSELLLQGFAICEGILEERDTFNDLSSRFKLKFKRSSKDELIVLLKKIHSYASDFMNWDLFKSKNEFQDFNSSSNSETRLFHYLTISPTTTIFPILMFLRHRIKDSTDYLECTTLIESYLIRRTMLKYSDKGYNKTFSKLIEKLRKVSYTEIYSVLRQELYNLKAESDIFPNNDMLKKLHDINIDHSAVKYILYWIALSLDHSRSELIKLTYSKELTIEHLMPQKWQEHWSAPLNEEDRENRDKLIYTIGNLSLLRGKLNSQLQNHDWNTKIQGNGENEGIAKLSILNLNKDISEGGLLNYKEWNEEEIEKRTTSIINIIKDMWVY